MQKISLNNAAQIGLALHAFHDTYGAFPAGYADKTGKPGLSWRVALLPFLEADNLFKQFKLDEPWNSEHNKKLADMMPKVFRPGNQDSYGYTFYRAFTGQGTWMPPQMQKPIPGQMLKGVNLNQIVDGTSITILVAEASTPVIWTKPDELEFAPNKVPKIGGGVFRTGSVAILANGSPMFLKKSISDQTLSAAITISGAEPINLEE